MQYSLMQFPAAGIVILYCGTSGILHTLSPKMT